VRSAKGEVELVGTVAAVGEGPEDPRELDDPLAFSGTGKEVERDGDGNEKVFPVVWEFDKEAD